MSEEPLGGRLLVAATLIFGFVVALGQVTAYDIWALLAGGRYILAHGLPRTDPFSFTASEQPWVNQSWLTQVIFYVVYRDLGRFPLMLLKTVVVTATLAIVWWTAVRRSRSPAAAALVTVLVAVAGAPWWHVRPQIFTYLCLAASLALAFAWQAGRQRAIWGFPVIMVLWANLHAGFPIGLVVLGLSWVGVLLEPPEQRPGAAARRRQLAAVTVLTILATGVTPYGVRVATFPLQMTSSAFALTTSVDWYSPNFLAPTMLPALAAILLLCAALALSGRRLGAPDLLLVVVFLGLALRSGRHIPLLLIATGPLLAELLPSVVRPLKTRWVKLAAHGPTLLVAILLLGSAARVWSFSVPTWNPFLQDLNEKRYPVEVVRFFETYRPPAELFNTFNWAGYELWALPRYRVFIDNRFEVYPESVMRDYLAVTYVTPQWEEVLSRWQVRTLIVERGSALAQTLRVSRRWALVFTGREAAVFLKVDDPLTAPLFARLAEDAGSAVRDSQDNGL